MNATLRSFRAKLHNGKRTTCSALTCAFLAIYGLATGCANGQAPRSEREEHSIEKDLDAFLQTAWQGLKRPPGLALAVYSPHETYVRGIGVTDTDTGERVTPDTVFYIASNTKAVTALAMNLLHHRDKIDLDATLADYSPNAPFPNSVHPQSVILRDLLTHTSGIENRPIIIRSAYTGEHTPALLWELLGASETNPKAPLGSFQYTNGGYNILTILTDRKLGAAWQDLLAKEVFAPAGMLHTTAYMSKAKRERWSIAQPHVTRTAQGSERITLLKSDDMMQSAGGLLMSANDSLRWLELLVNDGRIDGKQVFDRKAVAETRQPLIHVGDTRGKFTREHYGLGWFVGKYRGETVVHHSGGFAGFAAFTAYLPEKEIGVAVYANDALVGRIFAEGIVTYVYDRLLGHSPASDPSAAADTLVSRYQSALALIAIDADRRAQRAWTLSQPKTAYVGTYRSLVGTLEIFMDSGQLQAKFGSHVSSAEPFTRPDSIRIEVVPLQGEVLEFEVDLNGRIKACTLAGMRFERAP